MAKEEKPRRSKRHFEDTQMNPTTKGKGKEDQPEPMKSKDMQKRGRAMDYNLSQKERDKRQK